MAGSILGTRVLRTEDPELLFGEGHYVDDLGLPGALHAVFVRSEFAHGRIVGIDLDDARTAPGVVGVFTAAGKLLDLLGVASDARAFAHVGAGHRLSVGASLPAPAPIFPRYVEAEEGASTPAKP